MSSSYQAHIDKFTSDIVVNGKNKIDVYITFTDVKSGNYESELYVEFGSKYLYKYLVSPSTKKVSFVIPVDWVDEIPNSPIGTGKIRLQCVDFNKPEVAYTETKSFTVYVPEEFKPKISKMSINMEDIHNSSVDYAVYGLTRPNVMAKVTPYSNSPIKKWTLSGGGVIASGKNPSFTSTNSQYNFEQKGQIIKTWSTTKFKLTVEDARGRTASIESAEFYVYPYNRPIVQSLSAYRTDKDGITDADGDHIKVTVEGAISPLKNSSGTDINTLQCFLSWKETTEDAYEHFQAIENGEPFIFEADKELNFDIRCTLRDKYMETEAYAHVIGEAKDFNIAEGGGGAAIGMKATKGYFDVEYDSRFQKEVSAEGYMTTGTGLISYGTGSRGDFLSFGYAERLKTYTTPGGITYWADFNDCTSVGIWGVYSDDDVSLSNTKPVSNCPCEKAGTLRVYYATGDTAAGSTELYLMQEYVVRDGSAVYRRCLSKVRDNSDVEWPENWTFGKWTCFGNYADYIVEQGQSGIWTYRKWNSGIVECWGRATLQNVAITSALGNGYYSGSITVNFPFTITQTSASFATRNAGLWVTQYGSNTDKVVVRVNSVESKTYESLSVYIDIKGTWK